MVFKKWGKIFKLRVIMGRVRWLFHKAFEAKYLGVHFLFIESVRIYWQGKSIARNVSFNYFYRKAPL